MRIPTEHRFSKERKCQLIEQYFIFPLLLRAWRNAGTRNLRDLDAPLSKAQHPIGAVLYTARRP